MPGRKKSCRKQGREAKRPKAPKAEKGPKVNSRDIDPPKVIVESLNRHSEYDYLRRHIDKLWELMEKSEEQLQDIDVHINLLTRLLTSVCVEKIGMRVGVLKRLIKRIEKEAIRDSQINHLESIYKLPRHPERKDPSSESSEDEDPWEEIA